MLFDEEFQKLAEEKSMSCSELASKIIELMCDDKGNYTFGPPSCDPIASLPVCNTRGQVIGFDLSSSADMTND